MAEWMDMKVLELEQYDDQEWCHRIVVEEHDTLGLYALNQLIRDLKDSISTYYDLSPSKGCHLERQKRLGGLVYRRQVMLEV